MTIKYICLSHPPLPEMNNLIERFENSTQIPTAAPKTKSKFIPILITAGIGKVFVKAFHSSSSVHSNMCESHTQRKKSEQINEMMSFLSAAI